MFESNVYPLWRGKGLPSLVKVITVYPKKYAHGFCFAVLCCGYTLTDFPISIRLTSLALWQSNDCPSASKATLMNMDKYFMWIHYEWLHNHNKAKHNKTVCILLGIYCICRLFGVKLLLKPMRTHCRLDCSKIASVEFVRKEDTFIREGNAKFSHFVQTSLC